MHVNTICLCGSTRFLPDFAAANVEMTKRGYSVITISMALPKESGEVADKPLKELLDLVHFNKILRSDAVVIVGDGYVGFSTAREILWARMQGKPVVAPLVVGYGPNYDGLHQKLQDLKVFDETVYWAKQAEAVLQEKAGA